MKNSEKKLFFSLLPFMILFGVGLLTVGTISLFSKKTQTPVSCVDDSCKTPRTGSLPRIGHGGGVINGFIRSDSIQALNANADAYDFFEIDLSFTADGELVCIHDWHTEGIEVNFFWRKKPLFFPRTLKSFEKNNAKNKDFTHCTLATLIQWMDMHPSKKIVTDVKSKNVKALALIAKRYPTYINRFIPEIFTVREWDAVKKLGYNDIILSLYKVENKTHYQEALEGTKYDLFAITLTKNMVPQLARILKDRGMRVYAFPVNSEQEFNEFKALGVDEIYSDTMPQNKTDKHSITLAR